MRTGGTLALRSLAFLAFLPRLAAAAAAPTEFEALATDPASIVVSSHTVGVVASVDSTVTVAVLVVAARSDAAQRMSGARFELRNNGGTEQVYLGEHQLTKLASDLGLMGAGGAGVIGEAQNHSSGTRVLDTESC